MNKKFSQAAILLLEILFSASFAAAQDIRTTIRFVPPDVLKIEGKLLNESKRTNRNWFFRQSIADVENLGARVSEFALSDEENRFIAVKKLADGEYLAEDAAANFTYQINVKSPENFTRMTRVSWLSNEQGILMLDDLLPQFAADGNAVSAEIAFDLPPEWKIISREKNVGENSFYIENIEKGIFSVGKNWREEKIQIGQNSIILAISGEWQFSDADVLKTAREILSEYQKTFGALPSEKTQIFLARAPQGTEFGRWTAETRGASVTIVSAEMPFKNQSLQLLQEQLRHEFFHLWLPNKLALTGNYDWFYEGFTIYQALRTGVALNQIRFEDFLDTLAQAYAADSRQSERISLIESSKNRWRGANGQIYGRGILTAFLCDVALLRSNRGKRSMTEIFREIYRKHQIPNKPEDGNAAILKILQSYPELRSIIEKYVNGAEKINWNADLQSLGIETTDENLSVRLKVKAKPNYRQKDLLDKLGYNNWRKISGKRK